MEVYQVFKFIRYLDRDIPYNMGMECVYYFSLT